MQLQECLAEACGEGGSRFGYAALGTSQLCGKAGEEVVLGLLRSQYGYGRQHAESVSGEEDHVLCGGRGAYGAHYVLNMVDGVGYAGVLGNALIGKVYLAVLIEGYILEESIALDGVVDIRLGFLIQINDLCIASAFEVEHAIVVPAVLVVAYQQALGVGRQRGLAGAGKAKEDGGILAVHVGIGRAVHGGDTLEGQIVVHHGEETLLHFAAVPGVDDDLLAAGEVEYYRGLGIKPQLLVVLYLCLGGVVNYEIRLKVLQLLFGGPDKHILYKVGLPGNFYDEADRHAGVLVGAAEGVHYEQALIREFFSCDILDGIPGLDGGGVVIVLILIGSPPDGILGGIVNDDKLVLG